MKNKNKIVTIVSIVLIIAAIAVAIVGTVVRKNKQNQPDPIRSEEQTETEKKDPVDYDPVIPIIDDDRNKEEPSTGTETAEVIVDIAEYDNGHNDEPSVVGEVYINPGHKEDTSE